MADLLDVDSLGETGFLRIVALQMDAKRFVLNAVCCGGRMMAVEGASTWFLFLNAQTDGPTTYLTCSLTRLVVPALSSHFPKNNSPRKGLRGFFSLP